MGDNVEVEQPSFDRAQELQAQIIAREQIIGRLRDFGIPSEQLEPSGLVAFVKDKSESIDDLVTLILREDEDARYILDADEVFMENMIKQKMAWLRWLMTEGDPDAFKMSFDQGGVCGAVFGRSDVAYRCKTCEQDPTSAMCISCFDNDIHKDHDYYVLYTGGGCCDCGDETSYRREGFCPLHKGAENILPSLEQRLEKTFAPVLLSLFRCWQDKLTNGDMFSILKHIEMDMPNADICFWNQASNPVLANDPFSTLMWVLFCLPHPFLSCEESLISLVHVFYVVAVTQAIILYYEKSRDKSSREPSLSDCLIMDVYKIIGESGCVSQYFVSNYFEFDPSVDIKDMIRRFSFPYLRRCALLWKILYSSIAPPFCGKETMSSNTPKDTVDEVTEIEELENMFKIPPLDVVLKDEFSRSSVSTWCRHFCKEFQSQRLQRNIHVTPAVPFELMKLPSFYHELLQRYIKQHCPDCRSCLADAGEPALCLLCGRLCSLSQESCCRKSGCQTHAATCGAGTGAFLLIRKTNILLQSSARQALWHSPYLDGFDEEDINNSRGKPLSLKEECYAQLSHMVASHRLELNSKFRGKSGSI